MSEITLDQLPPRQRNMPINQAVIIAAPCLLRSDFKSFGDVATIEDVVRIITENTCPGCGYMSFEDDGTCFECEEEKKELERISRRGNSISSINLKIIFHPKKEESK